MPDQPDYYATIHWGSQGQAVRDAHEWDVDVGHGYWFYAVEQLLFEGSGLYGPGAVAAGKVLLVDSWGGSSVERALFGFAFGASPVQSIHRPARDGFVVVFPRPERFVAGEQCVVTVENHGTIASIVMAFFSGRLLDA